MTTSVRQGSSTEPPRRTLWGETALHPTARGLVEGRGPGRLPTRHLENRMSQPSRIDVLGEPEDRFEEILSPGALAFLVRLHDRFADRRTALLAERERRAAATWSAA